MIGPEPAAAELVPWTPPTGADMRLLDRRTDSWTAVLVQVAQLAREICDTDMIPEAYRGNPAAVTAIVLAGREVGLPPMRALGQSFLVNGKVGILAEAQRGLILAAGHSIEFQESTGIVCRMRGRRRGTEYWHTVVWTSDMARAAGILEGRNRNTWKRYPRQMLKARATAELARDLFADVIGGYAAAEEMADLDLSTAYTEAAGAEADGPAADRATVRRRTTVRKRRQELPASGPPTGRPDATGDVEPPLPGDPDWKPDDEPSPNPPPAGPERETITPDGRDGEDGPPTHEPADSPLAANVTGVPDPGDRPATRAQVTRIVATFDEFGVADRADRLDLTSRIAGRALASANELTRRDAAQVIDVLEECRRQDDPATALDQLLLTLAAAADPPPIPDDDGDG